MRKTWQLQEAKSRLSELVKQAEQDGPQIITRHGEEVAVVLSYAEYTRLHQPETSLVEFMRSSPLLGEDLDMERDQSPLRQDLNL
jgi:antitoxin Phd